MTTPYTYLLKHIPTGKVYYGCRYAIGCSPTEFWNTYKTSSKYVKELIDSYGADTFIYEIRKVFNDADGARLWEHKVLKRMRVIQREDFLNMTDNISISPEAALKGIRNRKTSKQNIEHARKLGLSNKGKKHSAQINKLKGHPNNKFKLGVVESDITRERKRLSKLGKPSNAIGNKQPKCSCVHCRRELTSSTIKQHISKHHNF